jgi:hypothetical protein
MKLRGSKESQRAEALARSDLGETTERGTRETARHEIGMGLLWLALGTACAVLAWILLSILLK